MATRFRGFLPVVIDVETGGFNSATDALLEIAAVTVGFTEDGSLDLMESISYHVTPFEGANIEPARDIIFVDGPADDLDHAASTPRFGGKIGIDATAKGKMEGLSREWPPDIVMSDEIKRLVDIKWGRYGI